MTYPETLSNDRTGREFLRTDLADTPEAARAELARRLSLTLDEVAPIEGRVQVVPDSALAYEHGCEEFFRPARYDEQPVSEYWQTEVA